MNASCATGEAEQSACQLSHASDCLQSGSHSQGMPAYAFVPQLLHNVASFLSTWLQNFIVGLHDVDLMYTVAQSWCSAAYNPKEAIHHGVLHLEKVVPPGNVLYCGNAACTTCHTTASQGRRCMHKRVSMCLPHQWGPCTALVLKCAIYDKRIWGMMDSSEDICCLHCDRMHLSLLIVDNTSLTLYCLHVTTCLCMQTSGLKQTLCTPQHCKVSCSN